MVGAKETTEKALEFARVMEWLVNGGHIFEISKEESDELWRKYKQFEKSFTKSQRKLEAAKKHSFHRKRHDCERLRQNMSSLKIQPTDQD